MSLRDSAAATLGASTCGVSGSMADFAADLDGLVRIVKKIQYWPYLIDGCLAGTGLRVEPR
jgi:hypothetical protein